MATKITINGQTTSLPGVYSSIKSGITNPPLASDFGNILIIDDGSLGIGKTIGAGVAGEDISGVDSIYELNNTTEFLSVINNGPLSQLAEPLFIPNGRGSKGVNKVFYLKAGATSKGIAALGLSKGSISFKTKGQGTGVNGILSPKTYNTTTAATLSNEITQGFGVKLIPGTIAGSYQIIGFRGANVDVDTNNTNGLTATLLDGWVIPSSGAAINGQYNNFKAPEVVFRSQNLTSIRQIEKFLKKDSNVKAVFGEVTVTYSGTNQYDDALVPADASQFTALAPYALVTGGTESYSAIHMEAALEAVKSVDNTFILALNFGATVLSALNLQLVDFVTSTGGFKYEKFVLMAAGFDETEFEDSINTAQQLNTQRAIVVHAGGKIADRRQPSGFRIVTQLYKAALVLGRICGLEPQSPITLKKIALDADIHNLTKAQKERAVEAGLLYTEFNNELGARVIGYGINTLQENEYLITDDGNSYDIAVERIKSQLNKEIVFEGTRRFFSNEAGPNRNTVSEEEIKTWLQSFLLSRTASTNKDGLIIRGGDIQVVTDQDIVRVKYRFVPNFPTSKLVFEGYIESGVNL